MTKTIVVEEESGGKKGDGGKLMYDLMYYPFLDRLVSVLTFGAKKYEPHNWKKVSRNRYEAAMMRHLTAYLQGEKKDPETGISHLAHVTCTAMFLDYFDDQSKN